MPQDKPDTVEQVEAQVAQRPPLQIQVGMNGKAVVLRFNQPIAMVGLPYGEAAQLGHALIKAAKDCAQRNAPRVIVP